MRAILIAGVVAAIAFAAGAIFGVRYHVTIAAIRERSSTCSLADLPAFNRSRVQRKAENAFVRANSHLVTQDAAGLEQWSSPEGSWWVPKGDGDNLMLVLAEQRCDIYSSPDVKVQPGDVVLDCGAHVGSFTRKALGRGAKLVVAIEPAPENLECLRRNLADEIAKGRVVVYPKGVWDRNDVLVLSNATSAQHSIVANSGGDDRCVVKAPLTTIDELTAELKLPRVDFIKMDIEGAEERALTGAAGTLATYRPRLGIAGYHNREDGVALERVVRKASASYQMQHGPCFSARGIRPETLFFH